MFRFHVSPPAREVIDFAVYALGVSGLIAGFTHHAVIALCMGIVVATLKYVFRPPPRGGSG